MKKIEFTSHTNVNNFIDVSTGELIDQEVEEKRDMYVASSKETFFYTYSKLVGLMRGLDGSTVKLLQWIAMNAQYNTNIVYLGKSVCDLIYNEVGLSYQTVKNSTTSLKKAKILIPMSGRDAAYRINPKYFWRGERTQRTKVMKYILEVECPDCEV